MPSSPESVVERQLAAYNARDLSAFIAAYAEDAVQLLADGTVLARGRAQIAERMRQRFADERLRAVLLQRIVVGETVMDHEQVRRKGANGPETVEMACLYAVANGLIARATFAVGEPRASIG